MENEKNIGKSYGNIILICGFGVIILLIAFIVFCLNHAFSDKWKIDKGQDEICTQVVIKIYEDNEYQYTVPNGCVANYKVVYSNGEKYTLNEALSKKKVTIDELISKGVNISKSIKIQKKVITSNNSVLEGLTGKNIINSENELNEFENIYSVKLGLDKNLLKENTIFVQMIATGNGAEKIKFNDVKISSIVSFDYAKETIPDGMTGVTVMTYYYLIAVVPSSTLKNVSLNGWTNPLNEKTMHIT